jgi:fucose 4-O-acetylase-like acetyltransferase
MNPHPHLPERLHALDNLRATMMWLGIVLHVAVIHLEGPSPLPWHDDRSTPVADLLMAFIHAFRMPVFFILAGFFVALLVQRRGTRAMVRNRLQRLALPFAVFWSPIYVVSGLLALLFLHRMERGTWGIDQSLLPQGTSVPQGPSTMHLWFLWMLLWFSLLTVPAQWLLQRLPAVLPRALSRGFGSLGRAPWGFIVLALPLAWVGSFYGDGLVKPSGHFLPPLTEWLHNGLFYVFGIALHQHQKALFPLYLRRWPVYAVTGLACFMATGVLYDLLARPGSPAIGYLPFWIALAYNACSWLWSFTLIGLFLAHLQRPHSWLAYLADSSYWVYLVHMPLTIGIGALLFGLPLPALAKMLINVLATTAICLVSYHLCVRFTPVSSLLNGKRHVRKPAGDTVHAA